MLQHVSLALTCEFGPPLPIHWPKTNTVLCCIFHTKKTGDIFGEKYIIRYENKMANSKEIFFDRRKQTRMQVTKQSTHWNRNSYEWHRSHQQQLISNYVSLICKYHLFRKKLQVRLINFFSVLITQINIETKM